MEFDVDVHLAEIQRGDDTTLRELMFRQLRRKILGGSYARGEKLIEEEIADQYKVSRTPVREAFRKLELEGLVQYLPRRGVVVTGLSPKDMDEIYATREVLEGLAARLAAEHATDTEIEELRQLLVEMNEASTSGDFPRSAKIHTRFNEVLYRLSRNSRLQAILAQFSEYTEQSKLRSLQRRERAAEIRAEHELMFQAILRRDAAGAELAARLHVANARRAFFGNERVMAVAGAREVPEPGSAEEGDRREP